jgi:energy-coupling factor transport system ATP-binding protein
MVVSPLIDIERISYSYPAPGSPAALREVSLRIEPGEYVALLGHNGSGKSTLARHCNALLLPGSGRVLVNGRDTRDQRYRREVRDQVGMIFQNPDNQIIATVVADDVAWALAARGMPAPQIRERVAWALAATGIAELRDYAPHRLSGGQRQRLAIAGVLALRPAAIIADEATAMLDPLGRRATLDLLGALHRDHGLAIILVTHLLEEAARAQRVVVLEHGRVAFDGTPAAIFANLERMRRLRLAVPAPIELVARLRGAGIPLDPGALTVDAIAEALARCL